MILAGVIMAMALIHIPATVMAAPGIWMSTGTAYSLLSGYGIVFFLSLCIVLLIVSLIMKIHNESILKDKNLELEDSVCRLEIARQEAEEARHDADCANREKSTFLSKISYEIRTPLNAMIGLTEMTKEVVRDNPVAADNLEKMMFASNTLLNIINDILDRSENDQLELKNERFNFRQLITSIGEMYDQLCRQKKIDFHLYLSGITEEILIGDQLCLNQILNSLLSNALKYTSEGGSVELIVSQKKVEAEKVFIQFEVVDTGCNLCDTPQQCEYAKEGLSVACRLVNLMQGALRMENTEENGRIFTVSVPFGRTCIESGQRFLCRKLSAISCLIVDDDASTLEYASQVLDRIGVSHESADSGQDAIRQLKEAYHGGHGYDVCFIDWKIPSMDGVSVTKKIREIFDEDTLMIIVSAYDFKEVYDVARQEGANLFLPKPMFQSALFEVFMNLAGASTAEAVKKYGDYDFSGHKVMLVDDTALNLEVMVELLKLTGLDIDCAVNGQEAVDLFLKQEPGTYDLILMDIQMPVLNGHDATRKIRASAHPQAQSIPVIAMTANAFAEDITESLVAGMDDHLIKPIGADVLYQTLEKYLQPGNWKLNEVPKKQQTGRNI